MDNKAWDRVYKDKGNFFINPHDDIPVLARQLKDKRAKKILDLGSGSGRHTVYLAKQGFEVFGIDNSEAGIELTRDWLEKEEVRATLINQEMTAILPFENNAIDGVISIQTIHHATIKQIKGIIGEIIRVLSKGGILFISVPKFRNQGNNFKEIEKNTFIPLDGIEKDLPHHYFSLEELKNLLCDFTILDIHLDKGQHYCVTATKLI